MFKLNTSARVLVATMALSFAYSANAACIQEGEVIDVTVETKGRNIRDRFNRKTGKILRAENGELLVADVKAIGHNCKMVIFSADKPEYVGMRLSFVQDGKTQDSKTVISDPAVISKAEEFLAAYKRGEILSVDLNSEDLEQEALQEPTAEEIQKEEIVAITKVTSTSFATDANSIVRILKAKDCENFATYLDQTKYAKGSTGFKNNGDISNFGYAVTKGNASNSEDLFKRANEGRSWLPMRLLNTALNRPSNHIITVGKASDAATCLGNKLETTSTQNICVSYIVNHTEQQLETNNCSAGVDVMVMEPSILKTFLDGQNASDDEISVE